ncbi:MAG: glycosyltransferase [Acidimicrobiales bacterium]|nr:glycosyltransferase [Acidimicrobiales bacterium]
MHVSLDVTSLLDPPTGVGVFTGELLDGLARRDDVDLAAFAISLRGRRRLADVVPPGVRTAGRPFPARVARRAWLRVDRPTARSLVGRTIDVVHGPNFVVPPGGRGVAEVVTVHDLTALHFPELCTADVLQWPPLLARALGRGAWVHTVSGSVADEVRTAFPAAADRVVAIANGVRPPAPARPGSDEAAGRRLAGGGRFVLAVGTVEPRKDLPSLVRAFDALAADDADLRLVIAGPDGWGAEALTAAVDAAAHRRRIVRLGWVDDQQRLALMRAASVVAYPSRYEGFGLVPLEALAVGTPVVATAVGALPEVLGDAAPLVAPGDGAALAAAIDQVLTDDELRATLLARGAERVAAYRWEDTVDGIVDLYRRALAG